MREMARRSWRLPGPGPRKGVFAIDQSLAHSRHAVLDALEDQIERLRRARPHLDSRITKAEPIIVTQLACPRRRIIRVHVGVGHMHYLVAGTGGAVYTVDRNDWSCSCPDHHRRGGICKHAISCWVLERAAGAHVAPRQPGHNPLWGTADPERLDKVAERLGF